MSQGAWFHDSLALNEQKYTPFVLVLNRPNTEGVLFYVYLDVSAVI